MKIEQQKVEISPYAILAAALFNLDRTRMVKVKADDTGEESEIEVNRVGIEKEGNALIMAMHLGDVLHFAHTPYDVKTIINGEHIVMTFEKREGSKL